MTKSPFCLTKIIKCVHSCKVVKRKGLQMDAKLLREFFGMGVVSKFTVQPEPMSSGWYLVACVKGEDRALQTARGGVRVFASLDTLVGLIEGVTGRKPQSLAVSV